MIKPHNPTKHIILNYLDAAWDFKMKPKIKEVLLMSLLILGFSAASIIAGHIHGASAPIADDCEHRQK